MVNSAEKNTSESIGEEEVIEKSNQESLAENQSHEIFIALVGAIGAGTGYIVNKLKEIIDDYPDIKVIRIKVSALIDSTKEEMNYEFEIPKNAENYPNYSRVHNLQNLGDEIRKKHESDSENDYSAVAKLIFRDIRKKREIEINKSSAQINKNKVNRIYIIDSLKHYDEVFVLKEVYESALFILGVMCDTDERKKRLSYKLFNKDIKEVEKNENDIKLLKDLLKRDESDKEKYGQQVSKTFHLSDYFIDNSKEDEKLRKNKEEGSDEKFKLTTQNSTENNDQLAKLRFHLNRFLKLILQESIIRPSIGETAMHHAYSAKLRSACLSRQVGASLVDKHGKIVATGTNDVPKFGGGLYEDEMNFDSKKEKNIELKKEISKRTINNIYENGDVSESIEPNSNDNRCFKFSTKFCSNTRMQNNIIEEMIVQLLNIDKVKLANDSETRNRVDKHIEDMRKLKIGDLLEFSRAVHAEMHALLSAASDGVSLVKCKMYVTTFPCHNCARHIVVAGINEVQYIEPYPKSMATELHCDSITLTEEDRNKKVLFRPFVGVSPILYRKVFFKDRDYKDSDTGLFKMGNVLWSMHNNIYTIPYKDREKKLEWKTKL